MVPSGRPPRGRRRRGPADITTFRALGYAPRWQARFEPFAGQVLGPARVVRSDRGSALVATPEGIVRGQLVRSHPPPGIVRSMSEDVREVRMRPASAADAAALAELAARLFRQTYEQAVDRADLDEFLAADFSQERMRAELTDPAARTLLVENAGRAIGYAQLRRRALAAEAPMPEAEVELQRLYLDRRWHGRGLAVIVLARAADLAVELGATYIWLGVWEHNGRAIAFYEKHGFRHAGVKEFRLGGELHHDRVMVAEVPALVDAAPD